MTDKEMALKHWPTDYKVIAAMITSPFGMRIHPVTKEKKMHQGVDIKPLKGMGEPVYAACGGVVSAAKANRDDPRTGYGWYVVIHHGSWCTLYAHLAERPPVKEGQQVAPGQVIGKLGNTGASTGPHLHFGIARGNFHGAASEWIDPKPLLGALPVS